MKSNCSRRSKVLLSPFLHFFFPFSRSLWFRYARVCGCFYFRSGGNEAKHKVEKTQSDRRSCAIRQIQCQTTQTANQHSYDSFASAQWTRVDSVEWKWKKIESTWNARGVQCGAKVKMNRKSFSTFSHPPNHVGTTELNVFHSNWISRCSRFDIPNCYFPSFSKQTIPGLLQTIYNNNMNAPAHMCESCCREKCKVSFVVSAEVRHNSLNEDVDDNDDELEKSENSFVLIQVGRNC